MLETVFINRKQQAFHTSAVFLTTIILLLLYLIRLKTSQPVNTILSLCNLRDVLNSDLIKHFNYNQSIR